MPVAQYTTVKFSKKLLQESEIDAVLKRFDRLTEDEARMTVAQTLGVVHGLVANIKVVLEGAEVCIIDLTDFFLKICSVRWQCVNG
jgi:hypothetical protein